MISNLNNNNKEQELDIKNIKNEKLEINDNNEKKS